MTITADTNVLVRISTGDDARQAASATAILEQAHAILVPLPVLCEYAWVLRSSYNLSRPEIAQAIHTLIGIHNVRVDRPAALAGLAVLEAGGDFADGAIAKQGSDMGGNLFVTFDRKAAQCLQEQGVAVHLLR